MAIENTVSIDFWSAFLDSIGVFDCRLPAVGQVRNKALVVFKQFIRLFDQLKEKYANI